MAIRCYAKLGQARARDEHFLSQVKQLAVLLDDPVRKPLGLEPRDGHVVSFKRFLSFLSWGKYLEVDFVVPTANALGEVNLSRSSLSFISEETRTDDFWKALRSIPEKVQFQDAIVYGFPGRMEYKGKLTALRFCDTLGDRIPQEAIENKPVGSAPGTWIYFNREPGSLDAAALRDLVCDVTLFLQLGYQLHNDSNPKVAALALMLQERLRDLSSAASGDVGEVRRLLEAGLSE